jgi:molybdenum cofactor cytidylyltransferase
LNVVAVILAAGGSRRFGRAKQLAAAGGMPLLLLSVAAARASRCRRVMVVLGSDRERIEAILPAGLEIVYNPEWKEGMASSIRAAVRALAAGDTPADAVLLMACDQPHVSGEVLDRILGARENAGTSLAACEYDGSPGIPALFAREHFPELLQLGGDRGARSVLLGHPDRVARVPWEGGAVDIDTPGDMEAYRRYNR